MKMKKRALSIVLTLAMLVTMVPMMGVTANGEGQETATADTTWFIPDQYNTTTEYTINNTDQLAGLAAIVNHTAGLSCNYDFSGKTIKLSSAFDNSKALTTSIGLNGLYSFNGTFDGNGKTVKIAIDSSTQNYVGFFGHVGETGIIRNVSISGTVKGRDYVGGVVGILIGTVLNCISSVNVTGEENIGGIVGYCAGRETKVGEVLNSCSMGNVSGKYLVAGVVGKTAFGNNGFRSKVFNCFSTGEINCAWDNLRYSRSYGGVVAGNSGKVENSYFLQTAEKNGSLSPIYAYYPPIENEMKNNLGLCEEQMKSPSGAAPGEAWKDITINDTVIGKVPLVDALNAYVNNKLADGYSFWGIKDGYPAFFDSFEVGSESSYATISSVLNDSSTTNKKEAVITLSTDITENIEIPDGYDVIINLNGKTISGSITNNGRLTLTDSTGAGGVSCSTGHGVEQNGSLTLMGKASVGDIYLRNGKTVNVVSNYSGTSTVSTEAAPQSNQPVYVTDVCNIDLCDKITSTNTSYKTYYDNTSKKLILSLHEHAWVYSLDSNDTTNSTLKAVCNETFGSGNCSHTTDDTSVKIKIEKPTSLTYDENAKCASISGGDGLALPDIKYRKKNVSDEYGDETTTAPTKVGTYEASITLNNAENAVKACVVYTIEKAKVDVPNSNTAIVFDGSEKTGVSVTADAKYSLTNNTGINAGDYCTVAALDDTENYVWNLETPTSEQQNIPWSIAKAEAVITQSPTAIEGLNAGAKEKSLIKAGATQDGIFEYAIGVNEISEPEVEKWSVNIPKAKTAGTYYVWYRVVGDQNHLDTKAQCIKVEVSNGIFKNNIKSIIDKVLTFDGFKRITFLVSESFKRLMEKIASVFE